MTARKVVSTKGMAKAIWLDYRNKGVGGSDISALLRIDQYRNATSVWLEKMGQAIPVEENFKMKMGNLLEPIVAQLFAEEHPEIKIRNNNFILQHETIDCMLANIDREIFCPVRGKGVLEIKTTSDFNRRNWKDSEVPENYFLQVQHYLAVTGYNYAFLAILIGGNTDYKSYFIERDNGIIDLIEKTCIEFWDKVESKTMPDIEDGSDATHQAIATIYPNNKAIAETVELPHLEMALTELDEIRNQKKELDERESHLQALVKLEIGNNHIGKIGSYFVTWKPQTSKRVDSKMLEAKFPDIHAQVLKNSESRPFKFAYKGE